MSYIVRKQNLFNFLKSESIIVEVDSSSTIEIVEDKNEGTDKLQRIYLTNLNNTSTYWQLNPETSTFLQPNSKKVESIIIELSVDNSLNIFLMEMKSKHVNESDVSEKFSKSLSWIYLLLNLLNHDEELTIKVFGILVAQRNMNWNSRETLNILSSTSIRYNKKSFFTEDSEISIAIATLVN